MPYPYSNSIGKTPPKTANAQLAWKTDKDPVYKPKPKVTQQTQEMLLKQLHEMKTLKFPDVHPLVTNKDFPGNHPANKYGKSDPNAAEPKELPAVPNWAKMLDEQMEKILKAKVQAAFAEKPQLPKPVDYSLTVEQLDNLVKDVYENKAEPYYGSNWSKPAPQFIGKIMDKYNWNHHCHELTVKLKIDGLSIDETFYVNQAISDHAVLEMNTDMLSHVLDDTFAKMKQEIMKKAIQKAGEK